MFLNRTTPNVYIPGLADDGSANFGVATNVTAFLGRASEGPVNEATIINSFADYERLFGGLGIDYPMSYAVNDFYQNGGVEAIIVRLEGASQTTSLSAGSLQDMDFIGDPIRKSGLYALDKADQFNILCIPPDQPGKDIGAPVYASALTYCAGRRAMLIVDAPMAWGQVNINDPQDAAHQLETFLLALNPGDNARNAALYFPRVERADPLGNGEVTACSP